MTTHQAVAAHLSALWQAVEPTTLDLARGALALDLAMRLEDAEPRFVAALAKELRATLDQLPRPKAADDDDWTAGAPGAAPLRDAAQP